MASQEKKEESCRAGKGGIKCRCCGKGDKKTYKRIVRHVSKQELARRLQGNKSKTGVGDGP